MKGFAKALIHRLLAFVIEVFFREAEGLNCDKIPTSGPVIFVCAPHANQVLFILLFFYDFLFILFLLFIYLFILFITF